MRLSSLLSSSLRCTVPAGSDSLSLLLHICLVLLISLVLLGGTGFWTMYNLPSTPSPKYSIPTPFTAHLNLAIHLAHLISPLPASPPPPQHHFPIPPQLSSITTHLNPL